MRGRRAVPFGNESMRALLGPFPIMAHEQVHGLVQLEVVGALVLERPNEELVISRYPLSYLFRPATVDHQWFDYFQPSLLSVRLASTAVGLAPPTAPPVQISVAVARQRSPGLRSLFGFDGDVERTAEAPSSLAETEASPVAPPLLEDGKIPPSKQIR